VLEAVRRESNVAWILLGNATVDSLSDGVLTLKFAREGDAKGFTGRGREQDLARVLAAMFGTAPQIKTTAGGPGGSSGPAGRAAAGRPDRAGPGQPAPASGPATATRQAMTDRSPAAGRSPADGRAAQGRRPDPPARPGDDFADDPGPYDADAPGPAGGGDSLTGMDLIERELGGKIIEEPGAG
jgi:hypothetical protein